MSIEKQDLEEKINKLFFQKKSKEGWELKLGNELFGGVVSGVYSLKVSYTLGKTQEKVFNLVAKITEKHEGASGNFSEKDIKETFSLAPETAILDYQIQEELRKSGIHLPKSRRHGEYTEGGETYVIDIMDNFEKKGGYQTLQNLLLGENLPKNAGKNLGKSLAKIRLALEKTETDLVQVENPETQFNERFDELKVLLYFGKMDIFEEIRKDFLGNGNGKIAWTDGDQKNFALNKQGEVMAYDFGRSIICDPDFMLPNLLGHIALFTIGGYLSLEEYKNIFDSTLQSFRDNYKEDYELNEQKFVNYFTASLIHRGTAFKWISTKIGEKIGENVFSGACTDFTKNIFGIGTNKGRTTSIEELMKKLEKVQTHINSGGYTSAFSD